MVFLAVLLIFSSKTSKFRQSVTKKRQLLGDFVPRPPGPSPFAQSKYATDVLSVCLSVCRRHRHLTRIRQRAPLLAMMMQSMERVRIVWPNRGDTTFCMYFIQVILLFCYCNCRCLVIIGLSQRTAEIRPTSVNQSST